LIIVRSEWKAFCRGFLSGFGSIGYLFTSPKRISPDESILALRGLPPDEYWKGVSRLRIQLAEKYVGKKLARNLYKGAVMMGDSDRFVDASKINIDYLTRLARTAEESAPQQVQEVRTRPFFFLIPKRGYLVRIPSLH